jgi:hypothetical protein
MRQRSPARAGIGFALATFLYSAASKHIAEDVAAEALSCVDGHRSLYAKLIGSWRLTGPHAGRRVILTVAISGFGIAQDRRQVSISSIGG